MCHTTVVNIAVHNWKRTPSVTNRSPPERRGMRFHVVCLLFSTSGEVGPGYSPTTRIRLIWIPPTMRRLNKVIAELSAAMAAIRETAQLIKLISDAKTESEISAAVGELHSKLASIQRECVSLVELVGSYQEMNASLKAKIADFEDFKSQSEGYFINQLDSGSLVYSKEQIVGEKEIMVHLCPHCFIKKQISILQPKEVSEYASYKQSRCPSCKNEFDMDQNC